MNPRALFLLLLVAALSGAAFFFLRTDDGGTGAEAGVGHIQADPVEGAASSELGPEDLAAADSTADEVDRQRMIVGAQPDTAPAASSSGTVEDHSVPVERGTLMGRVTDGNGVPLAGASVSATRRDLEDLFSPLRAGGSGAGEKPSAETDEDGRFSMESRAGELRIGVEADGFAPYSRSVKLEASTETDLGEIRLAPGVILRGRVVDRDGGGIPGARLVRAPEAVDGVTILGAEDDVVAVTAINGEFEVLRQAPGTYRFFVKHTEHPPKELTGKTEQPGETVTGLQVVLDAGSTIRGVVVGAPAGTTGLLAYAEPGPAASAAMTFNSGPDVGRSVPVGADGRFELKGLMAGAQYRVQLTQGMRSWTNDQRRSSWVECTSPKQGLGPEIQVPFSLGASVSFTVLDESGAARLPDSIDAGFEFARRREDVEMDAATGRCVIAGLWPLAEGQALLLELAAKGYQKWEAKGLTVYPGEQVDLGKITLVARPSVRVTVLDGMTSQPIEGARVMLAPPPEAPEAGSVRVRASSRRARSDEEDEDDSPFFDNGRTQRGTTDAEGVCTLDATAGESVVLTVRDSMHAPATVGPFALPENMTVFEQEVRLMEGGAIRVVALDPSGTPGVGYAVDFRGETQEEAARRGGRTGADGVLELKGLAVGEHLVRLGKRGGGGIFMPRIRIAGMESVEGDEDVWIRVSVGPGETVEVALEAPAIGALSGTVMERGVNLGGATVKLRPLKDDNLLAGIMMLGGTGSPSSTTDALGEYRILDVEAGDYELVVEHSTRAMPFTMPYTLEGGEQELDLDLSVTEVTGRVLDETGEPLAGARVEAKRVRGEDGPQQRTVSMVMMTNDSGGGAGVMMTTGDDEVEPATTDAEGRYRLRGVAHGVDLEITATAKGYDEAKSDSFSVSEGAVETDVDVRFVKPGSVRIEVEGLEGAVVAILRRAGETRAAPPKIQMVSSASTTIDGLGPGTWTVRLRPTGSGELSTDPDEMDVEVVGGETATASFKIM